MITAGSLDIRGEILSNGQDGSTNNNTGTPANGCSSISGSGGGGGGSGGTIWLSAPTIRFAHPPGFTGSTIRAIGGNGDENGCYLGGGAGGKGRVRIDFQTIDDTRFNGDAAGDPAMSEGSREAADLAEGASNPSPEVVGGFA